MDLLQGRSARQRNDFVLRLGCWMVTLSMVCSLVIQPPKAKAIVAEASLATSVIWAFMQSAGMAFDSIGMGAPSLGEALEPYLRDYAEWMEPKAESFWKFLGYDGAADFIKALSWSKITHPSTMPFPSVTIPPAVAKKLAGFTVWFAEKMGLASGGESKPVYSSRGVYSLPLRDGGTFTVSSDSNWERSTVFEFPSDGEEISIFFPSGRLFLRRVSSTDIQYRLTSGSLGVIDGCSSTRHSDRYVGMFFTSAISDSGLPVFKLFYSLLITNPKDKQYPVGTTIKDFRKELSYDEFRSLFSSDISSSGDSSITVAQPGALSPTYDDTEEKATIITIPGLDTEIAGINELLQAILDKLAANELTTSATIAQQPTPEQPDEEKPDIDGLGLPALGAALMTRFPFSIPWDVVRGIKLLAAPAEAPYWEVDFLAPIAGRVGGWKGSTKVVIDMGQYEIIGQLCRWTSTIGFCLVLAAGTKKLIWTA